VQVPIFFPPPIRRTQKCSRCGLAYPLKEDKCTHCSDLNNQELVELLERVGKEHEGNKRLGMYFGIASIVLIILLVLMSL
jgi:hypothetical protein